MRLIDADALRKDSKMLYSIRAFEPIESYTQDQIDNAQTVEAVPVVHGAWEYYHKQNKAVCTHCSFERDLDLNFGKAVSCPNCGAKMDL